jgi:hypothetical protein
MVVAPRELSGTLQVKATSNICPLVLLKQIGQIGNPSRPGSSTRERVPMPNSINATVYSKDRLCKSEIKKHVRINASQYSEMVFALEYS